MYSAVSRMEGHSLFLFYVVLSRVYSSKRVYMCDGGQWIELSLQEKMILRNINKITVKK